ncbi:ABC transporter permease subunit (plasmid) [Devosia sp. A8/3-2]|nr:ABC transporter permease subunit [Devosia sp. A8/3-2]
MFWLLTHALRNSLLLGLIVAGLSTVIGVFLGLAAGYAGGWLDKVLSFFMDALLCIPSLPILILMAALFGRQLALPIIGLIPVLFNWPYPARQCGPLR